MRILLAEDEAMISRLLERVLSRAGHSVTRVDSCADALELLNSPCYDIVLLDLHLADGNGIKVIEAMASGAVPSRPVVLMTGEVVDPRDSRASFAAAILQKPFDLRQLEQALHRAGA